MSRTDQHPFQRCRQRCRPRCLHTVPLTVNIHTREKPKNLTIWCSHRLSSQIINRLFVLSRHVKTDQHPFQRCRPRCRPRCLHTVRSTLRDSNKRQTKKHNTLVFTSVVVPSVTKECPKNDICTICFTGQTWKKAGLSLHVWRAYGVRGRVPHIGMTSSKIQPLQLLGMDSSE